MDILIVDDEKQARETIAGMVSLYCDEGDITLRQADSIQNAISEITRQTPDLLLLDIQLTDGNGFDLLKKINPENFNIVFITAYQEYAIKACKVSALDYLLKPFDPDELKESIEKARRKINKEKIIERLDALAQNMAETTGAIKKITIKTASSIFIINISDIIYCEADRNYTTFHLKDKRKIIASKPLGDYEEMINSDTFIRPHQSYLINTEFISRYEKGNGGMIITIHEDAIPVSSRKKEQVLQFFSSH